MKIEERKYKDEKEDGAVDAWPLEGVCSGEEEDDVDRRCISPKVSC